MDASDDLDLEGNDSNTTSRSASQPVKKNIQLKLSKPATRGRPKGKKGTRGRKAASAPKDEEPPPPPPPVVEEEKSKMEVDIMDEEVELVTIKSAIPVEPKHNDEKLNWNHKVNLIGEKVIDPFIYCCDKCTLPILIYGRMIPCKHVFCYDCAKKTSKNCPRCNEAVNRIEQSALGTVFVCMHGGSKHGSEGCRRTYLSHRDLQAHVVYRHGGGAGAGGSSGGHGQSQPSGGAQLGARQQDSRSASNTSKPGVEFPSALVQAMQQQQQQQQPPPQQQMPPTQQPPPMIDTRNPPPALPGMMYQQQSHLLQQPPPQGLPPPVGMYQGPPPQVPRQGPPQSSAIESYHTIPVMSSRRDNLISIQMQDEQRGYQHRDAVTNYSQPPPGYTNPAQGFPSVSHSLPPHSGGPPPVYANPSQSVAVPFSASLPPPMQTGQLSRPPPNMTGPPPIVRPDLTQPPPPIPAGGHMTGPPRYPSPHPHYDEQVFSQTGGHSPRTTWTGPGGPPPQRGPPPGGPPPQRAPPPTAPTSTAGMGLPPPGPYFQQ